MNLYERMSALEERVASLAEQLEESTGPGDNKRRKKAEAGVYQGTRSGKKQKTGN